MSEESKEQGFKTIETANVERFRIKVTAEYPTSHVYPHSARRRISLARELTPEVVCQKNQKHQE